MILKIEMNALEEVDFDFIGSEEEAIKSLIIVMIESEEFTGILKKTIEEYEKIKLLNDLKFRNN